MANEEIAAGGSGDDVARLLALTERQKELWTLLREAPDEETRNEVFDELTANRRQIAEIKDGATGRGDDLPGEPSARPSPQPDAPAQSVGEQLRAQIFTQPEGVAPPQPPPPPPPPPVVIDVTATAIPPVDSSPPPPAKVELEPRAPEAVEPVAHESAPPESAVERERAEPEPIDPGPVAADPVVPEPTIAEPVAQEPVVSDPVIRKPVVPEPTIAEQDPPRSPPTEPIAPKPDRPEPEVAEPEPTPDPPESPEPLRTAATGSRLAPEPTPYRSRADDLAALRRELAAREGRGPAVSDEVLQRRREAAHDRYESISRVRTQRPRLFPVVAILIAIAAVAAVAWFRLFYGNGGSTAAPPATVTTTTTSTTEAPVVQPVDIAAAVQEAVAELDLGNITVTEQVGTIVLSGFVDSDADREAVIAAAQTLAGTRPVDSSRVKLTPTDDEIRAAVEDALGDQTFDDVAVSANNGVAVLTGIVDSEVREDLVAAVASVGGVGRVVDATQSRNVAAELAAELRVIGGPNPIVYESGQLDLTQTQLDTLDEMADAIQSQPGPYVTVVGYTDPAGGAEENRQISQVRANLVRNYLIAQGVAEERIVAEGRGEDVPAGVVLPPGLERRIEFEIGFAVPPGVPAGFRIGIVAPSSRNDQALTQSVVQAADLVAAEGDRVGIDVSDATAPDDAITALEAYAAGGYDLVIAHGPEYGEAVGIVAAEYPGTAFVWGPGADTFDLPNVSAYDVAAAEGGYVMGSIAALITETETVGVVGSVESGEAQAYVDGFAAGVAATDSAIEVLTAYAGSTSDTGLASAVATSHVEAGADVLTGTDPMAVGGIEVADASNVAWFGNQADQAALAGDQVVASQVYHWEVALRQIVAGLEDGTLGGQTYTLTLGNGGLTIAYNPGYPLALDVVIAADTIIGEIVSGSLIVAG